MNLVEFKYHVAQFRNPVIGKAPMPFSMMIASDWFDEIAPQRASEYGVEGLLRFGPVGVFYQIANCYYRWKTLMEREARVEKLRDTLMDTFGFGVIMAVITDQVPERIMWGWVFQEFNPDELFETLLLDVMDHDETSNTLISQIALSLAYNMFDRTRKEYNAIPS